MERQYQKRLENRVFNERSQVAASYGYLMLTVPGYDFSSERKPIVLDQALDYFDDLARSLRPVRQGYYSERIFLLPDETKKSLFYYAQGDTVKLSLLTDYCVLSDELSPWVRAELAKVEAKSAEELTSLWQGQISHDLLVFWMNSSREFDHVLLTLNYNEKLSPEELETVLAREGEVVSGDTIEVLNALSIVHVDEGNFSLDHVVKDIFEAHFHPHPSPEARLKIDLFC